MREEDLGGNRGVWDRNDCAGLQTMFLLLPFASFLRKCAKGLRIGAGQGERCDEMIDSSGR